MNIVDCVWPTQIYLFQRISDEKEEKKTSQKNTPESKFQDLVTQYYAEYSETMHILYNKALICR
jgi:hypothetical protein